MRHSATNRVAGMSIAATLAALWLSVASPRAQAPVSTEPRQRGAHTAVVEASKTFTDELGLTVPAAPIDHPARVYPASEEFPTGPAIGERLPDFTLPNQRGERLDFHRHRAGRKAIVSFQRSAVW